MEHSWVFHCQILVRWLQHVLSSKLRIAECPPGTWYMVKTYQSTLLSFTSTCRTSKVHKGEISLQQVLSNDQNVGTSEPLKDQAEH